MEKIIKIGEKEVKLKATAATLRIYRSMFRRDLMVDMQHLAKSMEKTDQGEEFSVFDLEMFENVAFVMAFQGGCISKDIEEWLDEFEMFNIYEVLPEILEMWRLETFTMSESRKNLKMVIEK